MFISGRVQGVGFRYSLLVNARQLGLCGWVKNLRDGRVEAVLQGPPALVGKMLAWCADGPPMARVREVEAVDEPIDTDLSNFEVR